MREPHARLDMHGLIQKWGLVAERTSDHKLHEGIALILGYEADLLDTGAHFHLAPDIAGRLRDREEGQREGLAMALRALTDHEYIADQRGQLEDRIERLEKEQETDARD